MPVLLSLSETLVKFLFLPSFCFLIRDQKTFSIRDVDYMISKIFPILETCDYIVHCSSEETILIENVNFSSSK